jgi:hypothetical protein
VLTSIEQSAAISIENSGVMSIKRAVVISTEPSAARFCDIY